MYDVLIRNDGYQPYQQSAGQSQRSVQGRSVLLVHQYNGGSEIGTMDLSQSSHPGVLTRKNFV